MKRLFGFLRSDDGATAVEYAVMLALVIIACISGVLALGQKTTSSFSNSLQAINAATGS
jgi:pilus assembly protein Flp/PilA